MGQLSRFTCAKSLYHRLRQFGNPCGSVISIHLRQVVVPPLTSVRQPLWVSYLDSLAPSRCTTAYVSSATLVGQLSRFTCAKSLYHRLRQFGNPCGSVISIHLRQVVVPPLTSVRQPLWVSYLDSLAPSRCTTAYVSSATLLDGATAQVGPGVSETPDFRNPDVAAVYWGWVCPVSAAALYQHDLQYEFLLPVIRNVGVGSYA